MAGWKTQRQQNGQWFPTATWQNFSVVKDRKYDVTGYGFLNDNLPSSLTYATRLHLASPAKHLTKAGFPPPPIQHIQKGTWMVDFIQIRPATRAGRVTVFAPQFPKKTDNTYGFHVKKRGLKGIWNYPQLHGRIYDFFYFCNRFNVTLVTKFEQPN